MSMHAIRTAGKRNMECYYLPWTNCSYEDIFGTPLPSADQVA